MWSEITGREVGRQEVSAAAAAGPWQGDQPPERDRLAAVLADPVVALGQAMERRFDGGQPRALEALQGDIQLLLGQVAGLIGLAAAGIAFVPLAFAERAGRRREQGQAIAQALAFLRQVLRRRGQDTWVD